MMISTTPHTTPRVGWNYPGIAPWADIIQEVGERYNVDPHLIAAVIMAESSGRADVKVRAGVAPDGTPRYAVGLMQVIARSPGFEERPTMKKLLHPLTNITWGARILRYFSHHCGPTVDEALYCYSGGSFWPSEKHFRARYLARVQDWYKVLWGEPLPADRPITIPKPEPEPEPEPDKSYSP